MHLPFKWFFLFTRISCYINRFQDWLFLAAQSTLESTIKLILMIDLVWKFLSFFRLGGYIFWGPFLTLGQVWFRQKLFSISTKVWAGRLFKYIYLNFIVKSLTGKWQITQTKLFSILRGGVQLRFPPFSPPPNGMPLS